MNIVKRSVVLLNTAPSYENVLFTFREAARNCYSSANETNNNVELSEKLARNLIKLGHHASLEFNSIPVKIVGDRGLLAQITRHRCASFMVESTRYNNYSKQGINVIVPANITNENYAIWRAACMYAETSYYEMIHNGNQPEVARSVLPQSLAVNIVCAANIREWRHIFELRCDSHAQEDIREVMLSLLGIMYEKYPVFFEDLANKYLVEVEK